PALAADRTHAIDEAIATLQEIFVTNVFPQMNVTWGTYSDHLGHSGMAGGCFRCHNVAFEAEDGSKISADCELCHQIVAYERTADEIELVVEE
ncbi:MAG: cytochrome C, partial [marine benthic group bacterium]|nr:cytochrome C [Gemmatimonadota bacterium]MCL7980451.1 cytochrome C [Gemmatimonadota bacterium]